MRPFRAWPRWAIDALRAVLVRVPIAPGVLMQFDLECFARDVVEWADAIEEAEAHGYPCAAPGGIH
jgi:hypothetical protein